MSKSNKAAAARIIAKAAKHEIDLKTTDFDEVAGDLYIDGMDPAEWLDAMTMD